MSGNTQTKLAIVTTFFLAGLAAQASDSAADLVAATAAVHGNETPVATAAATTTPIREVIGENVTYGQVDGEPLSGYLVKPVSASGNLPGLIVIHEW